MGKVSALEKGMEGGHRGRHAKRLVSRYLWGKVLALEKGMEGGAQRKTCKEACTGQKWNKAPGSPFSCNPGN